LVNPVDGKGLHWVTDVHAELPVKMRMNGPGSEKPVTICELFTNQVKESGPRGALFVQRDGKVVTWTWDQYAADVYKFAKALCKL